MTSYSFFLLVHQLCTIFATEFVIVLAIFVLQIYKDCYTHSRILHPHAVLAGLKKDDEFILTRVENGRKGSTKLQVSIVGKELPSTVYKSDFLKDIMIQSMKDAAEVVAGVPDLGFRAEDARAIGLSLFIART